MLQGIDISRYQNVKDYSLFNSSGIAFCYIKATDGTTLVSTAFATQWAGVGKTSVMKGAYHFFRPTQDPKAQADFFISTVKPVSGKDLPPMLDIETSDATVNVQTYVANVKIWIDTVTAAFGVKPVIYTGGPFWKTYLGNSGLFTDSPLWVAKYSATPPALFGGWQKLSIWQYSAQGNFAGITPVDSDYFYGTLADLWNLAGLKTISKSLTYFDKVVALQEKLTALGFDTKGVDGKFGNNTETAVKNYQTSQKITADGIVTPALWQLLFAIKTV
ncbi:MAG: peptidoglycan-binding protein [Bacteroidia bacterium]|nr:peptidoglycan-binding protein [Bacteroidia bacterium]